jgi:transposase InsO family protein
VLMDERSRHLWVECFKSKRDVADWTSSKLREISREASKVGIGIVSLREDNGSEVLSNNVLRTLEDLGVKDDFAVSYSPSLNGMAERVQYTLPLKMRGILLEYGLPEHVWAHALVHAANCYNVLPHSKTKTPPHEVLYGNESCNALRSKLRIFGSQACVKYADHHPDESEAIYLRHASDTTVECYSFATHKVEKFDKLKLLEGQYFTSD